MAHVDLRDNRIFIVFDAGGSIRTGVTVNPQNPGDLQQAVRRAIDGAYNNPVTTAGSELTDAQYAELEAMEGRIAAEANRLQGRLNPVPPEPETQPVTPPPAPRETTPRETRPRERPRDTRPREERPREETPAPREEAPREPETPPPPPLPVISEDWIEAQLQNATGRDSRGRRADHAEAAVTLHAGREFAGRFLADEAKSTAATIAVFNALNEIPRFGLYLSSQVVSETGVVRPEFEALQLYLGEHGSLEEAPADIIRAADIYIRYFLLEFSAGVDAAYTAELRQLPGIAELLDRFDIGRTYIHPMAPQGEVLSEDLKTARIMFYCREPMDADTLTAAALYIRRWSLTHPQSGRAMPQEDIPAWTAPQVIPLPSEAEEVAAQPPAVPRIGIIGDSITWGGDGGYGRELQRRLRERWPEATVQSHGVSGQTILQIAARFERDILGANPPYNTVIIQGGINRITSVSVEDAKEAFTAMITAAREAGMRVILVTITPWEGSSHRGHGDDGQRRTRELNEWLLSQATADGSITVVDLSPLGEMREGAEWPSILQEYDSGDMLHPNDGGRTRIGELIYDTAYAPGIAIQVPTLLAEYAAQHWTALADAIYNAVREKDPAALVTLMRGIPGDQTLDAALSALGRTDLKDAFDRIFNDYLHGEGEFLSFLRGNSSYRNFAAATFALGAETRDADRRLAIRAVQEFLNARAAADTNVGQDMRILYRQVLGGTNTELAVTGTLDAQTMAALAVYAWRMANRDAQAGAWATAFGVTPVPAAQQEQRRPIRFEL